MTFSDNKKNLPNATPLPELTEVKFPHAVRDDEGAKTYKDSQGFTYIKSLKEHVFGFSKKLYEDKLSGGEVILSDRGEYYLKYKPGTELVSLGAIINVAVNGNRDDKDVIKALVMAARLLKHIKDSYNVVPILDSIENVFIDRWGERIEFLPPFELTEDASADDVLNVLREDSVENYDYNDADTWINNCFVTALSTWSKEDE